MIPWDGEKLVLREDPDLAKYPGFELWYREAENLWIENRSSERLSLAAQVNYRNKLAAQFPAPEHRLAYTSSGQYLAAARISDSSVVIDSSLYWAPCSGADEARYLATVCNSRTATERLRPLQARGEHNSRHFHMLVFQLPIPRYNAHEQLHVRLAGLGEQAEAKVGAMELPEGKRFERVRRAVRDELAADGVLDEIDTAVDKLLA